MNALKANVRREVTSGFQFHTCAYIKSKKIYEIGAAAVYLATPRKLGGGKRGIFGLNPELQGFPGPPITLTWFRSDGRGRGISVVGSFAGGLEHAVRFEHVTAASVPPAGGP